MSGATGRDIAGASLGARVVLLAAARGASIATAESLTGGLLADALVSVPGASAVFRGGIVAYATELKHTLLGVDERLLRERGPVDGEVAEQMAEGVRRACGADFGVATTGVAGPDPDPQTGQPAGTVWIGVSSEQGSASQLLALEGERPAIRAATVERALRLLIAHLSERSET